MERQDLDDLIRAVGGEIDAIINDAVKTVAASDFSEEQKCVIMEALCATVGSDLYAKAVTSEIRRTGDFILADDTMKNALAYHRDQSMENDSLMSIVENLMGVDLTDEEKSE